MTLIHLIIILCVLEQSPRTSSKNKCKLMDYVNNDEVVAEGRWQCREPKALVNGLPLGPNAIKVYVDTVLNSEAYLWRPTVDMRTLEDSLNCFVAWPANRVVIETTTPETTEMQPSSKAPSQISQKEKSSVAPKPHVNKPSPTSKAPSQSSHKEKSPVATKPHVNKHAPTSKPQVSSPRRKSQVLSSTSKCIVIFHDWLWFYV